MILTLILPLMHVKGGIKYGMDLPQHLIPVKAEVKRVNFFDNSFDARSVKAFKGTTALHTFDLLCQRRSKAPRLCIPLISL